MSNKTEVIAIVGSRDFPDLKLVTDYVNFLYRESLGIHPSVIISGGARGVDITAEKRARQWNMYAKTFKADWDKHGKKAGYIRNKEMIEAADKVIAFWDGESKGTEHSINLAKKAKKPINIFIRHKNGK